MTTPILNDMIRIETGDTIFLAERIADDAIQISLHDQVDGRKEIKVFAVDHAYAIARAFLEFDAPGDCFVKAFPFWA